MLHYQIHLTHKLLTMRNTLPFTLLCILLGLSAIPESSQAADVRDITFPVIGSVRYSDDFGDPRSGHTHEGNDLLGRKLQPLVAAVTGTIRSVAYPQPEYGYAVFIEDEDGYQYWYLHINNDTPGTDDGRGGGREAYAPDMERGLPVVAGQLIGWMGDSGNAEGTTSHLHFEIHRPDGNVINPYLSLQNAVRISQPITPPQLPFESLPFGQFPGGTTIATGELNGDISDRELVAGAGSGSGPHIAIYNDEDRLVGRFTAFAPDFRGGIDVATGDVDGDGIDEIITTPLKHASPIVRIFTNRGVLLREFLAFPESMKWGLNVAAADLNGDGAAEIIVGPRSGAGPQVRVLKATGDVVTQFFAYPTGFRGGVDVAAAPATATGSSFIVTGAGPGGGPHVRVFDERGQVVTQFFPYDQSFRGGVRVAVGNFIEQFDDQGEPLPLAPGIMTGPASVGGADFRLYSHTGTFLDKLNAFERWWSGGYDVAIGNQHTFYVSSNDGGRRSTIREAN